MKILLKEDNSVQRKYLKTLLKEISKEHNLHFDITTTINIKEIVNINRQTKEVINILDIMDDDTHEETGIKAAQGIREYNPHAYIIFITAFDSFVMQAINSNIEPIAYISKADIRLKEKLEHTLLKILGSNSRYTTLEKLIFTSEKGEELHLDSQDIYMIETVPNRQKYIKVETGSSTHICRGTLSDYIDKDKDIVQCHKSILVNKSKIHKFKKGPTSKSKYIEFDTTIRKKFPDCILSFSYKKNLI